MSSPQQCAECADGRPPTWCGSPTLSELAPELGFGDEPLNLWLCRGESPADAARRACASSAACAAAPTALPAVMSGLLRRTVMRAVRSALASVTRWMPPKERSLGGMPVAGNINYGVQPQSEPHIDEPHGSRLSYTDVLGWLLLTLCAGGAPCRYLEIGVSVGKNLHGVAQTLASHGGGGNGTMGGSAQLIGFDLEP